MSSEENVNEWSTGLCDCTKDWHSCCLTCWCPCVTFGRSAVILDKGESSCCVKGSIFYLLNLMCHHGGFSWLISMGYRTKLRHQYGIKKGSCPDCMIHCFCQPCALCLVPCAKSIANFNSRVLMSLLSHKYVLRNMSSDWSTGLFDCFHDCGVCCLTCLCPCVTFGQNAEIIDRGQRSCCQMGCIFYILNLMALHSGFAWLISMGYRTKIRRQYGIDGDGWSDCLTHFCCQPCALCQEHRELKSHGFNVSAGWDANVAKQTCVTRAPVGEAMNR